MPIVSFYAHKATYEKPIEAPLDMQTSYLCGINVVFVINKYGVYGGMRRIVESILVVLALSMQAFISIT